MERKIVSILEACELVGVARRTIYNWLRDGKVEYVRTAGGRVRIFADTLWRDPNASKGSRVEVSRQPAPQEARSYHDEPLL